MKKRNEMDVERLQSLVLNGRLKKFVSLDEGAAIYSVGKNTFREMAKDAQAMYRIKRRVLVNLEKMDDYMAEKQDVEWKESWRDEYLKWICGFANAKGGRIYIGTDDNGKVVGLQDSKKLMHPRSSSGMWWRRIPVSMIP